MHVFSCCNTILCKWTDTRGGAGSPQESGTHALAQGPVGSSGRCHGCPAKWRSLPAEGCSFPADGRCVPVEDCSFPAGCSSFPTERRSFPAEWRSGPAERRSFPAEWRSSPAERRSFPAERRSFPAQGRTPGSPGCGSKERFNKCVYQR